MLTKLLAQLQQFFFGKSAVSEAEKAMTVEVHDNISYTL
jgi:hypothetical protein